MFPFWILFIYFGPGHKNTASLFPSLSGLLGEYVLTQSVGGLERALWLMPHKFLPSSCVMQCVGVLFVCFFNTGVEVQSSCLANSPQW